MFLSRIIWRPTGTPPSEFWKLLQTDYGAHKLLWSLFADSPERTRDFLYRQEGEGDKARFFVLSEREPVDKLGLWEVGTKHFAPEFTTGERLIFSLRANPTVKRGVEGHKNSVRHDVIMDEKRRAQASGEVDIDEPALVQRAGLAWLAGKGPSRGFALDTGRVRVDGYRQWRFRKTGGHEVRFSSVEYDGVLTVTDPALFTAMLQAGIGPSRAFGCGLMMVKRA